MVGVPCWLPRANLFIHGQFIMPLRNIDDPKHGVKSMQCRSGQWIVWKLSANNWECIWSASASPRRAVKAIQRGWQSVLRAATGEMLHAGLRMGLIDLSEATWFVLFELFWFLFCILTMYRSFLFIQRQCYLRGNPGQDGLFFMRWKRLREHSTLIECFSFSCLTFYI